MEIMQAKENRNQIYNLGSKAVVILKLTEKLKGTELGVEVL